MIAQFIRWEILKSIRSTSYARSLLVGLFLFFVGLLFLSYVFLLGLVLKPLIVEGLGQENAVTFLNKAMVFFVLVEILYRYFIQRLPVMELESLLHLPVSKNKVIHFLLVRSFISPLNIMAALLFGPFAWTEIAAVYGTGSAFTWLSTVMLISWSIHWIMLWFKQRFEDSLVGVVIIFLILLAGSGSTYFGIYDPGIIFEPIFAFALESPIPLLFMLGVFVCTYVLCFRYYRRHAYLEDLMEGEDIRFVNQSLGMFSRFGLMGEVADLEWKLIIRHKKSRTYLMLCAFFLLYGLLFYINPAFQAEEGFSYMFIFVGSFITGVFVLQYGQLFLSWNSSSFDFFLNLRGGMEALIRGKYLLFIVISCLCFLLSVPYVYFGWDILFIHIATFLFNMGITIHLVIFLAIWKPKPMDLSKGAMFNYEGVGIAQFLMVIPLILAPYVVFVPFSLLFNDYAGLVALALVGIAGILGYSKLSSLSVNKVLANRYEISSSFRQEL